MCFPVSLSTALTARPQNRFGFIAACHCSIPVCGVDDMRFESTQGQEIDPFCTTSRPTPAVTHSPSSLMGTGGSSLRIKRLGCDANG